MSRPKLIGSVVDFSSHEVVADHAVIDSERMVSSGTCQTTTWNHYTDPAGQFFSGIWASDVGAMKISYTEEESCYILEGRIRLIDSTGEKREFGPGSAFVIPAGFEGIWETLAPVKKMYTIWQPKN